MSTYIHTRIDMEKVPPPGHRGVDWVMRRVNLPASNSGKFSKWHMGSGVNYMELGCKRLMVSGSKAKGDAAFAHPDYRMTE